MEKNLILWAILFAAGLLMIVFRMEISRLCSDVTALLVGGGVLALISGMGVLLELYHGKH